MTKTTWGISGVVVAAVLAIVFAASQDYFGGQQAEMARQSAAGETGSASTVESGEAGQDSSRVSADDSQAALQEEAESYVKELGAASGEPLQLQGAAGFTSPDQPVATGEADADERAEPANGADDDGGKSVADEVESQSATLQSATAVEPAQGDAAQAPLVDGEAGQSGAGEPAPDDAVPESEGSRPESESADGGTDTARVDLPLTERSPVTLAELLQPEETIASDAVLYVHTVQRDDGQGIWGIVQQGILRNFAAGVAIHRGKSSQTYQVEIPENADERRPDNSSSFLGRLIHDKTRQSYVYNYKTERIGRNPGLIHPGEEIVIVSFTPDELVEVYKHFVREQPGNE